MPGIVCLAFVAGRRSMPATLADQLRERRDAARKASDEILTRAANDGRDLTADEATQHAQHVRAEREAADSLERWHADQLAELRASSVRPGGGAVLTREAAEIARQFRSAIFAKNPAPIEFGTTMTDEWPAGIDEPVHGRVGTVKVHTRQAQHERDTLKTTATQALSVDVYSTIVDQLVEQSALMAAGATVVTTATGEDLIIPKATAYVTSNLIAEGASITESDPTLATVTLKAYKYASFFQISRELADDTPTNLLSYLAGAAALALSLGATGYGNDLINGNGTGKPNGLLNGAATGVTGPTGTGTSLGTQGTANQGTDALWNLVGSVAEPYAQQPSSAFVMRNASDVIIRKLKDTTGQPVQGLGDRRNLLGYGVYRDPFMPAMANAVESIAFGDMSKYFIRIVNGVRFERSDEYAFQNDLVSFKAVIRLDGALVDTNAVKTFVNTT
jgi:HK97 family phage major capsid protein